MNQQLITEVMIVDTNMSFEKSNVAVQKYKEELEKIQKLFQENFIKEIEQDFYALRSAFPELDKIFILGSTPKWNDGEECFHSSNIYIENIPDERWDDMSEYVERIYWDTDQVPDEFLHINTNLTKHQVAQIKDILCTANLENNLEEVFKTNFHVIIDFTEPDIKVIVEKYECGY